MFNLRKDANVAANTTGTRDLYPLGSQSPSLGTTRAAPEPQSALLTMVSKQTRFNYNDYMKNLNDKLAVTASTSRTLVGTGFQEFLLKERQQYLSSVANQENDASLLRSGADSQAF